MQETARAGTFSDRVVVMFGTQVVVVAVGIVNGILLARVLGPAGKGDYYLLVLLPTTMSILLQLGLPQAFEFFAARGQTAGLTGKSFVLTAVLSIIGLAVVVVFLPILQGAILHGIGTELVLLALCVLPFILQAPLSAAIVIGRQAVRWYAAIYLCQPLSTTILLAILVWALGWGVPGAILVVVLVAVINAIGFTIGAIRVSRTVPQPGTAPVHELVSYGLRFYPGSLADFFDYRTDAYLIAFLIANPAESLGYYSLSVALAEMVFLFPSVVATIFFPHVAGSNREDADRQVALVSRVTLIVSGAFALLLIPVAIAMIWTVLPAFGQSIPPFLVLLPGVVALSGAKVVGGYVTGIGRPGICSIVSVIALAVNVVVNLALIPRLGIIGAATASLVSYTLSSLLLTVVAARFSHAPAWRYWIPDIDDARYVATTTAGLVRRAYEGARLLADERRGHA